MCIDMAVDMDMETGKVNVEVDVDVDVGVMEDGGAIRSDLRLLMLLVPGNTSTVVCCATSGLFLVLDTICPVCGRHRRQCQGVRGTWAAGQRPGVDD